MIVKKVVVETTIKHITEIPINNNPSIWEMACAEPMITTMSLTQPPFQVEDKIRITVERIS